MKLVHQKLAHLDGAYLVELIDAAHDIARFFGHTGKLVKAV